MSSWHAYEGTFTYSALKWKVLSVYINKMHTSITFSSIARAVMTPAVIQTDDISPIKQLKIKKKSKHTIPLRLIYV